MPIPILKQPQIGDNSVNNLQYLSRADARRPPFTNKLQPSLEATALRVAAKKMKTVATQQLPASRRAMAINI